MHFLKIILDNKLTINTKLKWNLNVQKDIKNLFDHFNIDPKNYSDDDIFNMNNFSYYFFYYLNPNKKKINNVLIIHHKYYTNTIVDGEKFQNHYILSTDNRVNFSIINQILDIKNYNSIYNNFVANTNKNS